MLEERGLGDYIVERLGLGGHAPDLSEWRALVERIRRAESRTDGRHCAASIPNCTTPT